MFKCKSCGNSEFYTSVCIIRDVTVKGDLTTIIETFPDTEQLHEYVEIYRCTSCDTEQEKSEMVVESTHDFNDGKGAVPAHRHTNPDGTTGGWVANTAFVSPTAFVGEDAKVYQYARLCDNASITGNAQAYGSAYIGGNAHIYGQARIHGEVLISGEAYISGYANINGNTVLSGETDIH